MTTPTSATRDHVLTYLDAMVTAGEDARGKIANVVSSGVRVSSLWQLEGAFVTLARGELCSDLAANLQHSDNWSGVVSHARSVQTNALMEGWLDPSSTSALSNALSGCGRDAVRQFVKQDLAAVAGMLCSSAQAAAR